MVEKINKLTTNYIIRRLFEEKSYYFDLEFFSYLFHLTPEKSSQWFKRLKKGGFVKEVEKGKYILLGFEPEHILSEPFFIGTQILIPSYVSFWSALNFYGFTEQVPKTVFIASTKRKKEFTFENVHFKYIKFSPTKFFGYREEKSGELSYLVAEPEKALIDSLDQLRYAGRIEEVFKSLYNAKEEIDIKKLLGYARLFGNRSLNSRLGYLLGKIGLEARELKPFISQSYVKLDQTRKRTRVWDKDWHLNINITQKILFEFQGIY